MRERPTLEQVAVRAGVSRATVSRVVRKERSVHPHLVRVVNTAIEDLGYVPNAAARSLMTRRSGAVALIAAESDTRVFGDPFFSSIVRGVSQQLSTAGVQLSLSMAQSQEDLVGLRTFLSAGAVDGAMVISEHEDLDLLGALSTAKVPLVSGGRPFTSAEAVPYVDHENRSGAAMAVRRLVERGCARIGTIAGPQDMSAGVDRLLGFREALGTDLQASRIEVSDFTAEGGQSAARALLQREPDIDGLFVASDLMAMGVLTELHRCGRVVPRDLALVGFDDSDVAAAMVPPLTTIRQRTHLQGRLMARLLLEQLGHQDDAPWPEGTRRLDTGSVMLDVELIGRDSA